MGDIILCGDFNALTGNLKDFLENDDVQDLCINSCFDMAEELQDCNNRDIQISPFGRLLIEKCISFNLAILNGRTRGDLSGQYTCYTHNGASTIDYAIVYKTLIQHIYHVTVHPPNFNSCHSPLSFVLKLSCDISKLDKNQNNLKDLPYSFKWDDVFRNRFIETLESTEFTTKLESLTASRSHINKTSYKFYNENVVLKFNQLITDAEKKCQPLYSKTKHKLRKKFKSKKWYDKSCWELKKEILLCAKQVIPHPNCPITRGRLCFLIKNIQKIS